MECTFFTKPVCDLPVAKQARALKKAGFDGADFVCRKKSTVNPSNATEKLGDAVRIFREEGLTMPTLVSDIVNSESSYAEELFAACAENGIKGIRLNGWSFALDAPFQQLVDNARRDVASIEPLARKYGVRAMPQIHSGYSLTCNASAAMRIVGGCDAKYIGVQWDAGHIALDGEACNMSLAILGDYLGLAILKSAHYAPATDGISGEQTFAPKWVALSEGLVPVKRVLIHLQEVGYAGPLCFHAEHTGAADDEHRMKLAAEDLAFARNYLDELGM